MAILSLLFPSFGSKLSSRKSRSQRRLAAVEDSPLLTTSVAAGWTFSLLPNSLQVDDPDVRVTAAEDDADATTTADVESLGKRILLRPAARVESGDDDRSTKQTKNAHTQVLNSVEKLQEVASQSRNGRFACNLRSGRQQQGRRHAQISHNTAERIAH